MRQAEARQKKSTSNALKELRCLGDQIGDGTVEQPGSLARDADQGSELVDWGLFVSKDVSQLFRRGVVELMVLEVVSFKSASPRGWMVVIAWIAQTNF